MPIYEYVCTACGQTFEELVRGDTDGAPRCPGCRSQNVQRQLSVFAARQGAEARPAPAIGGCGRCGDPDGPCMA